MATWQVQQAKTRLSEVIEQARRDGPQTITKHGRPTAVVVSIDDYDAMQKQKPDLVDVLLNQGPKFDEFVVERDRDTGREIDLE